ncbi:DNA repair protein [Neohortaea acidophila]|uniref:DNA repair protein n=1 Tax=Neohortaea acidophila TaxID=245834 RepID=A0A6A6PX53_9PEZI|nr:DNA repair protein [Neohortaea acidophila]KAF2484336.1 DNA repair protein [Neohortaea acidophila]
MAEETESNAGLFHDVVFTYIPSEDLPGQQAQGLVTLVTQGQGKYIPLREDNQQIEDLTAITHIVSTHIEFPQYDTALAKGVHVVKPSWIIRSADKGRQAQIRQHSPDPSQFFRDVVVTTANLPEGDKDAIIAGVIALGGQYSGALSKLVTHIVTSDTRHDKCVLAVDKKLSCKIVLPHWFDDCFRLGRMISEKPYTFPDPELLREDAPKRVRDFPSPHLDGALVATPTDMPQSSPPPSPAKIRQHLNALMSRKVFFAKDLQLSKHLHQTLEGLINHAGGTLTDDVRKCDIYIGQYRDGSNYIQASQDGKIVANLSWLYLVINRNKYTNPLNKLLHYPVPRKGIPGFEHMRISISNYTGDARIYLENLVRYCGAEFTKTMKQDNTHLITAHTQSEKCEAAQEWNIQIVNHIWLEECYAKCSVQTLTNDRYRCFPARTNLGEVLGQTIFDTKRLEQVYYPRSNQSPQKMAAVPETSQRKVYTAADGRSPAIRVDEDMEDDQPQTAKKPRGRPRKTAATPRLRDDEKENESPSLHSSGRAAKAKAADRLHDQADDIALFQKEMKRKGGVTHGGRRSTLVDDIDDVFSPAPESAAPKQRKKRTSDEATYDVTAVGSDLSDGETQATPAKAAKRAKNAVTAPAPEFPPIEINLLVTGSDRWKDKAALESRDRNKLRQLGISLIDEATKKVDILVAPRILRTQKFVAALAYAPKVTGMEWLERTLKDQELDPDPPLLCDPEAEEKWGFNLEEALQKAKVNAGKLFDDRAIFVTGDVKGGFNTYKEFITLNGGVCFMYAGRTGLHLPRRRVQAEDDDNEDSVESAEDFEPVYLVSGDSGPEKKLWKMFRSLAEKQGLRARVVATDWVLHAAMSQEIVWKDMFELQE